MCPVRRRTRFTSDSATRTVRSAFVAWNARTTSPASPAWRERGEPVAVEGHVARSRRDQPHDAPERRGLPRAVTSDEAYDAAGRALEGERAEDGESAEPHDQPLHAEHATVVPG